MRRVLFFGISLALFTFGPATAFAASLTFGASGSAVTTLQQALIAKGYLPAGKDTGYFGSQTLAAVKKFQCDQHIVCSGSSYGVFGPQTQAALLGIGSTKGSLEISGWIPYWRTATGTADALTHLDQFTELNPFGFTVDSQGIISDPMHINEEPWTSLIAAAKQKKIRVIPTVMWGDGPSIHRVLSNTQSRIALEDAITNMVYAQGFDGIDIDFEGKLAETKPYFSLFLKGLYQRMGNKWVTCDIEARTPVSSRYDGTPPADATTYANDYVAINNYCDRVKIMTYDQGAIDVKLNDTNDGPYVPLSDPQWVEKVVTLAAQTISKKKLMIGIPTYGYEYTVTPLNIGFTYDLQWAFNPKYALDIAQQFSLTPIRNSAGELSMAYQPQTMNTSTASIDTTTSSLFTPPVSVAHAAEPITSLGTYNILWWSDAQAIADKIALARKLGVRGVAVFKIDGGEDPSMWNVLP